MRIIDDENFYISTKLTERQVADLDLTRSLIAVGGDLGPYYRRSQLFDELLKRQQILHLHLGGPGSDAILYLIQYPAHMLFLAVDGRIHLDDIPPGKRVLIRGRKTVEDQIEAAETDGLKALSASSQGLLRPTKPK